MPAYSRSRTQLTFLVPRPPPSRSPHPTQPPSSTSTKRGEFVFDAVLAGDDSTSTVNFETAAEKQQKIVKLSGEVGRMKGDLEAVHAHYQKQLEAVGGPDYARQLGPVERSEPDKPDVEVKSSSRPRSAGGGTGVAAGAKAEVAARSTWDARTALGAEATAGGAGGVAGAGAGATAAAGGARGDSARAGGGRRVILNDGSTAPVSAHDQEVAKLRGRARAAEAETAMAAESMKLLQVGPGRSCRLAASPRHSSHLGPFSTGFGSNYRLMFR